MMALVPVIAPLFLIAGVGFAWARLGYGFDTEFVTRLVTYVGTPCLVFTTVATGTQPLLAFATVSLAAVIALAAFALFGGVALKLARLPVRPFLPTVMMPNTVNMGLAVMLFAFGEEGLAFGIAFSTIVTVAQFTVGIGLAAGRMSWQSVVRTPTIHALILALAFRVADMQPPLALLNATNLLGMMSIPLMLVALGISLARLKVRSLGQSLYLAVVRLVVGVGVGFGVVALLGLDGVAAGAVLLQCAMPSAVFNFLFASVYKGPADEVAGAVIVSTTLTFLALPGLLLLVL